MGRAMTGWGCVVGLLSASWATAGCGDACDGYAAAYEEGELRVNGAYFGTLDLTNRTEAIESRNDSGLRAHEWTAHTEWQTADGSTEINYFSLVAGCDSGEVEEGSFSGSGSVFSVTFNGSIGADEGSGTWTCTGMCEGNDSGTWSVRTGIRAE